MGRKPKINKDVSWENVCFKCKEGGSLIVCDFKNCLKSYHPECVGKEEDFVSSKDQWICGWHACFNCQKPPKFQCYCCPNAVCGVCLCDAEFVVIKVSNGLCNDCVCLAGLIEGVKTPNPHEEKVDFSNEDTYEGMFKYYWEKTKEKHNLNAKNVRHAIKLLTDLTNYNDDFEVHVSLSSSSDTDGDLYEPDSDHASGMCQRKKRKRKRQRNNKPRKKDFIGWGSQALISFLATIGEDISQELSRSDVSTIILRYCNDHNLFNPEKKKKIICDSRLQSLLGRKSVNRNSVYNLLSAHYANVEQEEDSAEDDHGNGEFKSGCNLKGRTKDVLVASEWQVTNALERKCPPKNGVPKTVQSSFAAIITENVNLVYLKRSLLEELMLKPESFDENVIGSIVRVKSDPNDYMQRASHQLQLVTDIKRSQANACTSTGVLFQVSNGHQDIAISQISDEEFFKEECEDLCKRMKDGLLRRLTVGELQQKANALHEDITKHWISKELARLRNRIDQANEKGWKRELHQYSDLKTILEDPDHQSRLLQRVPEVIADHAGEFTYEDPSTMAETDHIMTLEPTPTSKRCCVISSKSSGSLPCMNNEAEFPDFAVTLEPCNKQFRVPEVPTDHAWEFSHEDPSKMAETDHIMTLEPTPTSQRCIVIGLKSSGRVRCMNNKAAFPATKSFSSKKPTLEFVTSNHNRIGHKDNSTGVDDEVAKGKMWQTKQLSLDGGAPTTGRASMSDMDTKIAELLEELQLALQESQRRAMEEQRRTLEELHRQALEEQRRIINATLDEWKREWQAKMSQTPQHGFLPNLVPSRPGKEQSKVPSCREPHQKSDVLLGNDEAVTHAADYESNKKVTQGRPETFCKEHPSEQLTSSLWRPNQLPPEVILSSDENVIILSDDEDPDASTTRSRRV